MAYVQPYGDPSAHGNLHNSLQFRRSKKGVILQTNFKSKPKYKGMNPVQTQKLIDGNNTWKTSPYETKHFFRQDGINKSKTGKELYMSHYIRNTLPSATPQTNIKQITEAGIMLPQGEYADEISIDFQYKNQGSLDFKSYGILKDNSRIFTPGATAEVPTELSLLISEKKGLSESDCIFWNRLEELAGGVIQSEIGPDGTPNFTPDFGPAKYNNGLINRGYNQEINFDTPILDPNKGIMIFWFKPTTTPVEIFTILKDSFYFGSWFNATVASVIDIDIDNNNGSNFYRFSHNPAIAGEWNSLIIKYDLSLGTEKKFELWLNKEKCTIQTVFIENGEGEQITDCKIKNAWNYLNTVSIDNIKIFKHDVNIDLVIDNLDIEGLGSGSGTRTILMPWKYELRIKWIDFNDLEHGATIRLPDFTILPLTNYRFYISTDWSTYRDPAYWKLCIAGV